MIKNNKKNPKQPHKKTSDMHKLKQMKVCHPARIRIGLILHHLGPAWSL